MAEFNFGTRVILDDGARRRLSEQLTALSVRKPLVVSDAGLVRAGIVEDVMGAIDTEMRPVLFDGTPENPTEDAVEEAFVLYEREGCDAIVGLGGGSPMDLAKALALRVGDGEPLGRRAFAVCGWNPPPLPVVPPLVLMPTTAGTGSEVSRGAILSFRTGRKSGILCVGIVRLALCDPELTYGLPPRVTAATGMDAISHCIEAFCSPTINPFADAIALDGLGRLTAAIETATRDGRDAAARREMMLGALAGGMCLQKGLGAIHALAHPLGALGIHHGMLNAVLMPHVLSWNASALAQKLPRLAWAMGLAPGSDVAAHLDGLRARLGLPGRLQDLGVERSELPIYADLSTKDSSQSNPCPMNAESYLAVLSTAW
ncbi:iron-containing alcohol dehydrogenase [Azospirillum endophyticum]